MSYAQTEIDVIRWAEQRRIIPNASPEVQVFKAVSDVGNLVDAMLKGDIRNFKLKLGDVVVTLIILAAMKDIDLTECLELAYEKIKDRRGTMLPNGVFVKRCD